MNRTSLLGIAVAALFAIAAVALIRLRQPAPAPGAPAGGACVLLDDSDLEAIQGEKASRRTPGHANSAGLATSQCYFTLPTASRSVSLVVTERGTGSGARDPKDVWRELFDAPRHEQEREHEEARGREQATVPEKLEGVGEEAVWLGNPIGGALYVRAGNRFLRISVGGSETPAQKKDKSVALARRVLAHL